MAVTINASTSAGLVQTADTSGVLALQTAGTTAVTVDASQNVGIGTTSPQSALQVSGAMPVSPTGNGVHVGITSSNTCMQFNAGAGNISLIDFSTSGTDYLGRILYNNADNNLSISTNSVERARFNSTGAFVFAGGSTSANGIGITFPATQSASTDVNTLDDYEEGSWTPSVGGTATYTTQSGRYTKIGNKVFIEGVIAINTIGTGSVGDISGLPFTTNASSPLGSISVGFYSVSATSITYISATLAAGQTNINLRVQGNAGGSMGAVTFFQNSASIYFTGQYTA